MPCPSKRFIDPTSSGKTTLASLISKRLNNAHTERSPNRSNTPIATFVPMDGFHLSRAQLSAMPDPQAAHARRGAEWTFDAPAFLSLVRVLRQPLTPETKPVHAPSFDHAVKDPVENSILVPPSARVVIFEGNYLSLGKGDWKEAAMLMDELWFVDVGFDVARKRLVQRHIKAGIAANEEEAGKRADENDLVNGREIMDGRLDVQEVIASREDEGWRSE